jgi:hypothetical protein
MVGQVDRPSPSPSPSQNGPTRQWYQDQANHWEEAYHSARVNVLMEQQQVQKDQQEIQNTQIAIAQHHNWALFLQDPVGWLQQEQQLQTTLSEQQFMLGRDQTGMQRDETAMQRDEQNAANYQRLADGSG